MDVYVLPDDDERMKDIHPGDIGSDGVNFYCRESLWPKLRGLLLSESTQSLESKGAK
jgi:hypothetical protein